MIVTLKEILAIAEQNRCAVGAFNTPNLETLSAVLNAATGLGQPVILSHAQLHEPVSPLAVIGPVMVQAAKAAAVPVCVHLDHGETLAYLEQALDMGFTGVMYDGSLLPFEENVANTKRAVAMARKYGASVEAEIGVMGGHEAGGLAPGRPEELYTDPELARAFVTQTGIDALAASFGTAHGIYQAAPKLDFPRISSIRERTGVPIVMHGGSGCSQEDYRNAIAQGVRKINYYSYMAREGVRAAKKLLLEQEITFYHDVALAAQRAMQEDAKRAMEIFINR